jgi:hypothetical protein
VSPSTRERISAIEALSVADALQSVAAQIARLERAGYPDLADTPEGNRSRVEGDKRTTGQRPDQ